MSYTFILFLAILFMLMFALEDTIAKRVVESLKRIWTAVVVLALGIFPIIIYLLLYGSSAVSPTVILLSILSGIPLALGYILIFTSLKSEMVTTTYAIGNIQSVLLVIIGLFVLNESLNIIKLASILIIFIGVLFLLTTERRGINRKLIPAIFANFSWTIFWIFLIFEMNYAQGFALPLLINRTSALIIILAFAIYDKVNNSKRKEYKSIVTHNNILNVGIIIFIMAITIGLLDGAAETIMGYVFFMKNVVIGSSISAITPIFIALFGYIAYKDKLTKLQLSGFIIMILGAIALAFA